jgi:hypothetical protein
MKNYLGIDVSKCYVDFALIDEQKQQIAESFQLDDTPDGHNQLGDFIRKLFKQDPDLTLLATAESTGGYENNWLDCLKKLQRCYAIQIARLNPKVMDERKINIARHLMKDPAKVYFFFCLSKNTASRNCFSSRLFCHNRCRLTDSIRCFLSRLINLLVSTGPNSLFKILFAVSISISSSVYFVLFISDFLYHKKKVDFLSKYSIQAVYIV